MGDQTRLVSGRGDGNRLVWLFELDCRIITGWHAGDALATWLYRSD